MSQVKTTISGQVINTTISEVVSNSASTAGSLVISTAQTLPTDKRYIYFTPTTGVQGVPADFDGDEAACQLHGFANGDPTCDANGSGHLASYYYTNGAAITLKLPTAASANQVYTIVNQNATQECFLALETDDYPTVSFTVPAGATLEVQKVSGTWEQVIDTSSGGGGLALGETANDAYRGDRGKTAYDHSQTAHNAAFVGLANVDNTSDANKPVSTATQTALNLKADLAGATFTGQIDGTDVSMSGELASATVDVSGAGVFGSLEVNNLFKQSSQSVTPAGATGTLDLDTYLNATLNMTSGSGLCTITLHVPAASAVTSGQVIINHHATTVRDLAFISTAPINWVGTQPDWDTLAAGSTTVLGYYFDGTEYYLGASGALVLGTTTGTAYDGGSGATLASTVSSLSSTVSGKITNGIQGHAGGGTATISSSQVGTAPNYDNQFSLIMGGTGTFASYIGIFQVTSTNVVAGFTANNVVITPTATTFTNAGFWRTGLEVLALAGGQLTGSARHTEVTSTPSGTTQTITLDNGNHQTLALTSASGNVTATLTVPSSSSAGTIIVKQHASAQKDITWAVSAGTIKWMGTEPDWVSDAVSSVRVVSWRYDGSVTYLAATEVGT